jgi:hypothetical protein
MYESTTTSEMTFERHFSVEEPGVVIFCRHRPGRRVYRTLRIPESIALRVYVRMRADDERRADRWRK